MEVCYRFCSSIHYFFERKISYRNADISSLFFITLTLCIYGFGIYYTIEIILHKGIEVPYFFYTAAYLGSIERGELLKNYSDAKDKKICINVMYKFTPRETGKEFLYRIALILKHSGYNFTHRLIEL